MTLRRRRPISFALLGVALVAAGSLAACGDDDDSAADTTTAAVITVAEPAATEAAAATDAATSEGTAAGSAAGSSVAESEMCADSEALRDSLAQLRGFDITTQRLTVLRDYVSEVVDDLSTLRASGSSALQPAIDDLSASVDAVRDAIDDGAVRDVATAVGGVVDSAEALLQQISDGPCPGVSSSIPIDSIPSTSAAD